MALQETLSQTPPPKKTKNKETLSHALEKVSLDSPTKAVVKSEVGRGSMIEAKKLLATIRKGKLPPLYLLLNCHQLEMCHMAPLAGRGPGE